MKKILKLLLSLTLSLVFILTNINGAEATCRYGILNNGLGGIYISINSAPYTTFQSYSYGQYAYTRDGCAWFASARVNQVTGKGNTIRAGTNWWRNGVSVLGTSRGQEIKAPAVMCWEGHVAILEKIEGSTAYVSEGGSKNSNNDYGYTIIRNINVNSLKGMNPNFLGFVYLPGSNNSSMVTPTISTNKTSYTVGETVNLSWRASPSNSNLSHYWLTVIANGSKWIYGGTMNKNTSYSFKASEVGNYEITVYATPVGSKEGEGSLIAKKTISVQSAALQPGKPTLKVTPGTNSYKTTFNWSKTSNTDYYAIRIYKKSSTDVYKLVSNIKDTSYSVVLPAGDYYAHLNSSNSTYKTYTFGDDVNFTVMKDPVKNSDGWYYVDKLPAYVNSSNYTIQYNNISQKTSKTSPGAGWTNKGLAKSQYENSGNTYWSKIELPTSNTRVLVSYYYYHYCGPKAGNLGNYELSGNYVHEDTITNVNSVTIANTVQDGQYKGYWLKWKSNGAWAYCNSNITCNGSYGTHGNRSYGWYRNSQYQNRVKVNYYNFEKITGWVNYKDSSATTVKYRFKAKASTPMQDNSKPNNVPQYNNTTITKKNIKSLKYSKISNKAYSGKTLKPKITIKNGKKVLKNGKDYTLSYKNNKNTGKATITIKGKGNYTGTKKINFYIVPKKVLISSVKPGKKQFTVKYKKVTGASGYQIAYSTSKSKGFKYITVNAKTASKVIKKLKSKKNYFIKVRAYKTVGKKKYYGSYSNIKSVKVK